ncbi:uncharacterized protein FHS24_001545 [Psychrobacter luti]|uniref:Uncharacterized protein n=1 Tax=Psychrobacter luti TaxID=198481 RepID=A0A839TCZ0_9GAMM|nr:hypothetical protein [Psychrobacter luti]MBB3107028.1 uncharacterized protein [Psychrobacter luti]
MLAVIIVILIIWAVMWGFYKFMYPRAPKSMMPKKGDVTTPRQCNFCGNSLAEYRGVLEPKPISVEESAADLAINRDIGNDMKGHKELFFCNYEHQADFHAGKTYQIDA